MATVCVYCSASEAIDVAHFALAAEVGTELGRRGHDLVTGGGSIASMGAVARAARAAGARTIGVIPRALLGLEVADTGADELVVTDDMRVRKGEMDVRSDAFLTLPGGIGTLEELLEIWVARTLGMHDKPVVVLDPHGLYTPLREQIALMVAQGFVPGTSVGAVTWTGSVAEALDAVEEQLVVGPAPLPAATEAEVLEAEP